MAVRDSAFNISAISGHKQSVMTVSGGLSNSEKETVRFDRLSYKNDRLS